ncbi:MAG TPA: DUF3859 domain-containing protein [Xanthobacteraceae bacterium]|jgi:hypothetical protein|nr:DUF3859 domain-containing protein [Xanthobacteraceae bacterium]
MKTFVAVAALLLGQFLFGLSIAQAQAPAPAVIDAKVMQMGTLDAKVTDKTTAPGVVTGSIGQATYHFVTNATTMEARKGISFGFEYRLNGTPDGAKVTVRKVTIFPSPGLRNPKTGEVSMRSEYIETNAIGQRVLKAYDLDNDWEVVPGDWVQQVWVGEKKVAEEKFTLTTP